MTRSGQKRKSFLWHSLRDIRQYDAQQCDERGKGFSEAHRKRKVGLAISGRKGARNGAIHPAFLAHKTREEVVASPIHGLLEWVQKSKLILIKIDLNQN